jgi:hypothetical protein
MAQYISEACLQFAINCSECDKPVSSRPRQEYVTDVSGTVRHLNRRPARLNTGRNMAIGLAQVCQRDDD